MNYKLHYIFVKPTKLCNYMKRQTPITIQIMPSNDPDLYNNIGPFAMNRNVIRYRDGYPVLNDDKKTWFIACKENRICGFLSTESATGYLYIQNVYTESNEILETLIGKVIREIQSGHIKASAQVKELDAFTKNGFRIESQSVRWAKVERI